MCGISVVVALQQRKSHSRDSEGESHFPYVKNTKSQMDDVGLQMSEELDKSLDILAHRGPDSRGQWISEDNQVGISRATNASRRLQYVDY